MAALDTTQQLIAALLGLGGVFTLLWKLFDLLSKAWDRKNTLEMLAAETVRADFWKDQADECRTERDRCLERQP